MAVSVNVALPSIDQAIKTLQSTGNMSTILTGAGQVVAGEIKKRWTSGSGADNSNLDKLSLKYAIKKASSGRKPFADMNYTGKMQRSFRVVESNQKQATIGFSTEESRQKARGNVGWRPNLLNVNEKGIIILAVNAFNKILRGFVKFK